jgi:uncharacterized membrane protein SpoIIM required for sporulation
MARTAEQFVTARRSAWERLDALVKKAQGGLTALSDDEVQELGALYRRTSADLARAQTRYATTTAGRELVRSLNDLVLRAHAQVYSAPTPQISNALDFVLYGFPATFRRQWRAILLAGVFLFGPGILAYLSVIINPDTTSHFVPAHVVKEVEERAKKKLTTGWGGNTSFEGIVQSPEISSYIMVNNIRVTLNAVALGVTAGIGTVLTLVFNGLLLGGLSGVATNEKVDLLYWAVILPHGIIELTAICIAGGAGLLLARAIYAPGDLPRRDALKVAGSEAARLVMGVALMLVVAGLIEGFITPQPLPPLLKISFALLTALCMVLYLNNRPRRERVKS